MFNFHFDFLKRKPQPKYLTADDMENILSMVVALARISAIDPYLLRSQMRDREENIKYAQDMYPVQGKKK